MDVNRILTLPTDNQAAPVNTQIDSFASLEPTKLIEYQE